MRALFGNLSILTEGLTYDFLETGVPEVPFLFDQLPVGATPATDGVLVGGDSGCRPWGCERVDQPNRRTTHIV